MVIKFDNQRTLRTAKTSAAERVLKEPITERPALSKDRFEQKKATNLSESLGFSRDNSKYVVDGDNDRGSQDVKPWWSDELYNLLPPLPVLAAAKAHIVHPALFDNLKMLAKDDSYFNFVDT